MANRKQTKNLATSPKGKYFDLQLKFFTGEIYPLTDIFNDMKIKDLKAVMEFVSGVPSYLQRPSYLDDADLMDDSNVRHHDIVAGGTIYLDVWNTWKVLIKAAAEGNIDQVMKLGVTSEIEFKTPSSIRMNEKAKQVWIAERAFVALCIAAHRGHVSLVQKLIDGGADVHAKTPLGRTALHIAAAQGKNNAVEVLLSNGAKIDSPDNEGKNPLVLAGLWGHKSCERQIFLFQWQQRAALQKSHHSEAGRMAHQMYDSTLQTWMKGDHKKLYMAQILPPGEYSGTALSAPRRERQNSPSKEMATEDNAEDEWDELEWIDEDGIKTNADQRELTFKVPQKGKAGQADGVSGNSSKPAKMAGVRSKKLAASSKSGSFDAWLASKQKKEQQEKERKRRIREAQKEKEEDEYRATVEKEKSYETWLKEQKPVKGRGGRGGLSPDRASPDVHKFDLLKIRKEMGIFKPVKAT
ncbi:uncharacterized protein LOC117111224 [Anneissia japonica]|uniref:uncharacterized protein LOC117111224 n=1 Tax=Anneissia japonica TaxID=1529436 RepID=UPI0014259016|nr:uncharacterized protein LOC117111224 [Anneissia japonica]